MKKKLSLTIVSLMCLGVFGLTACNDTTTSSEVVDSTSAVDTTSEEESVEDTSNVSNPVYNSIAISNKEALTASWKEEEADRELDLTIDPIANINLLLSTDMLTVTSSDTNVVTATGIKLHAAGVGTATITVTLISGDTTITDTVDFTIEAVAAPISLEAARVIAKGELVKTRGYVTSIIDDLRYATIADGESAIELYGLSPEVLGDIAVGDLILAKGTSSPYNGLMEIGSVTSLEKLDSTENADVIVPIDLVVTDWGAIPDASDSRIATIDGMILTSIPNDYVVGDLGSETANKTKRFDVGLTLDGKAVAMSVDYHNGWEACDAIYEKLASVPLTSIVDFHGLLTVYSNNYQIAPMSADDITVTAAELTPVESLAMLRTSLTALDYSVGTYEVETLPLGDTLGMYTVSYAVSTELIDIVAVAADTGVVTVTDVDTAAVGTITASIYDADSAMVGEAVVIDVTIKAVFVEPDAMAGKTLADLTAVDEADYKMVKYTGVTGLVSNLKDGNGSKYGNFDVATDAEGTNPFAVYGATASVGAIKFDNHDGDYYFSNPADFLTNEATAAIADGDEITFNAIRYAYGDTQELSIEITAIGGVDIVIPDPIITETTITNADFTALDTEYYGDATATVDGIDFFAGYTSIGNDWFQMKDNTPTGISAISNTTAAPKAIDSITLNFTPAKSGYDIAVGAFLLSTGSSAITADIESDTADVLANDLVTCTDGVSYTYTFEVDETAGNNFFKLSRDGGYTTYVDSIVINYVS